MAIEVGDAVFKFLGDTQSLDATFDSVGQKAKAAFGPATTAVKEMTGSMAVGQQGAVELGEVVNLAGKKSRESMYQARGEAQLLGEEFGIRLPRHVRSFIAELPGVGQALSAAFSATAVMFLAGALVEGTKKVEKWIEDTFIFNDAMKHSAEVTTEMQKVALAHVATMEHLHEVYVSMGENPLDKLRDDQLKAAQAAGDYRDAVERAHAALVVLQNQKPKEKGEAGWWNQDIQAMDKWAAKVKDAELVLQRAEDGKKEAEEKSAIATRATNQAETADVQKEALARIDIIKSAGLAKLTLQEAQGRDATVKLAMTETDTQVALLNITEHFEAMRNQVARTALTSKLAALRASNNDTKEAEATLQNELLMLDENYTAKRIDEQDKLIEALNKSNQSIAQLVLPSMAARDAIDKIVLPEAIEKWHLWHDAAKDAGITLREDLVKALQLAKEHLEDFEEGGGGLADPVAHKAFQKAVADDQKALTDFGKKAESELGKQGQLWKLYKKDVVDAGNSTKFFADIGKEEFQQFTNAVGTAFIAFANHTESFQKALGQMAKAAIDSLAAQSISQALYWTAVGLADTAVGDSMGATDAFAAAELFGMVAAVSGGLALAAGSMGGGAGGSRIGNQQGFSSGSNTGSTGRSGTSFTGSVPHLAEGGLITMPTLIMAGEAGREAVIPLDNPRARQQMDEAGVGGAGGGLTVHVHGLVSDDKLINIMDRMNKLVRKNQGTLLSSHSLRVTKRSA